MTTVAAPSSTLRRVRRIAIIFIVVSLSLTALVGIVTLLTGEFGEVQGKILLTTLLVAGFAITSLCHLAIVGRALRVVGFVGIGASAVALLLGTILIWSNWSGEGIWPDVLKAFGIASVLAVSFAHANLLLVLADRDNPALRIALFITVGFVAIVAILIILPIATDGEIPGDNEGYWRALGAIAILDVLGTIVLPVLARVLPSGLPTLAVRLGPEATAIVSRLAHERGTTPREVVEAAVTALAPADAPAADPAP